MVRNIWAEQLQRTRPKIHCITNPVSMQDVANILLAAGGSAIMAQDETEVTEITALCRATLLNTGVPDEDKLCSCVLAGAKANELGHPVVLDPVGAGASLFRKKAMELILKRVKPSIIRCNQEEACALLRMESGISGGVESGVSMERETHVKLAETLALAFECTVLVSGKEDVVSDGERYMLLEGGDSRMARITGSGCMLSALCALLCGAGFASYEAACAAGSLWKECSCLAGTKTDAVSGGIGSFHMYLFDAIDELCHRGGEQT